MRSEELPWVHVDNQFTNQFTGNIPNVSSISQDAKLISHSIHKKITQYSKQVIVHLTHSATKKNMPSYTHAQIWHSCLLHSQSITLPLPNNLPKQHNEEVSEIKQSRIEIKFNVLNEYIIYNQIQNKDKYNQHQVQ